VALAIGIVLVILGYLVGSIPFGLLIARWFKGVDIRTVGSGNIGATNVGRVLGFRFFLLVFALDLLKGLLPTLAFPAAFTRMTGAREPSLAVFVALAAILGHNFPIYLRLRGGKGVATSFGALLALDPVAMLATGISFVVFLLVTRMVSMSSLMGGIIFVLVHFYRTETPWGRPQWAMSVVTIGLFVLLVIRHRANLARIAAGTEPKVMFRKKRNSAPSGRIAVVIVIAVALAGCAAGLAAVWAARTPQLNIGPVCLEPAARLATGHQRAERVVFADGSRLLALTCPRYNCVVLARVSGRALEPAGEIALEGRPVALWPTSDGLHILQRPIADAHHLEAGWLEAFDFRGQRIGSRLRVGFDPDDLAILHGERWALVLTSGRAEGESNRPAAALFVVDLSPETAAEATIRARLTFDQPADDPERVALAPGEKRAAVSLRGSNEVAWLDLSDLDHPRIMARTKSPDPGPMAFMPDGSLIVASTEAAALSRIDSETAAPVPLPVSAMCGDVAIPQFAQSIVICSLPRKSAIELIDARSARSFGRLPIRGLANLAETRPLGLAIDLASRRIAIANRQGGSVHLVVAHGGLGRQSTATTDSAVRR
jgi:glycerol-3-phosphate acyltransferase PlsY